MTLGGCLPLSSVPENNRGQKKRENIESLSMSVAGEFLNKKLLAKSCF